MMCERLLAKCAVHYGARPSPSRHLRTRKVSPSDVIYRSGMSSCIVSFVCVRQFGKAVVMFPSAAPN